jgi:hypothetical protein
MPEGMLSTTTSKIENSLSGVVSLAPEGKAVLLPVAEVVALPWF